MHRLPKQYSHCDCWHQQLNLHYRVPTINKQYVNNGNGHWYWHWHKPTANDYNREPGLGTPHKRERPVD
jgi:hypothetical protein